MSLQEKFQITVPPEKPEDSKWTSFDSQRNCGEAGFLHQNNTNAAGFMGVKFNMLPPGMDISNQLRTRIINQPMSMAGATDVSKDTNDKAFAEGYTRREMKGTDDQYTGEHMDHFYGEVIDENGMMGFVERNNYLDRE